MNTKKRRFYAFMLKEKTKNFFALVSYVFLIIYLFQINIPFIFKLIIPFILFFLGCFYTTIGNTIFERDDRSLLNIMVEIKKIFNEIIMFLPILGIEFLIDYFFIIGDSKNQTDIIEAVYKAPIFISIYVVIFAPIYEELLFRFLPYKCIKNKTLYIIISAFVFAGSHVVNDPNPFYYIWSYLPTSLYFGYRYFKTKDLLVTISLHSFNNLIATLIILF